jgi:hypothetical protein
VIPICQIDTVKAGSMPLAYVLGDFEVIESIIACEPFCGKIVWRRKSNIEVNAHYNRNEREFEPVLFKKAQARFQG